MVLGFCIEGVGNVVCFCISLPIRSKRQSESGLKISALIPNYFSLTASSARQSPGLFMLFKVVNLW